MRRRISSLLTFPTKFMGLLIYPFLFVFIQGVEISSSGIQQETLVFIAISAVFFIFYVYFWSLPLKYVEIDDDNLYISNYRREITIPISEIVRVTEWVFSEPRRVTIHLKNPSEFGPKIVFLATYRMFAFFDPHPITEELERRALSVFMRD